MDRRTFLGAMLATASGLLVPGRELLVPDWGARVFPMFPRTHHVSIQEPLTGLFASKNVHWSRLKELVKSAGWTNAEMLRRNGWSVTSDGESRDGTGLIYIPRIVFDTAPDGESDWTFRQNRYASGKLFCGEWDQNCEGGTGKRATYAGVPYETA